MAKSRRVYYTMGQISEMFDLPASTIRFWEKRFKVLKPRKNAKGNRLFTPTDVDNLKIIYHLVKEKRMTLSGAETYMMQRKVAARGETTMVEILQRIRATLVEIRQELETAHQNEQPRDDEKQIVIKSEQIDDIPAYTQFDLFDTSTLQVVERLDDETDDEDDDRENSNQLSLF